MLDLGNEPARPFALLDLTHALRGPIDHQADDLTLVAPAAARAAAPSTSAAPSRSPSPSPTAAPLSPSARVAAALRDVLGNGLSVPTRLDETRRPRRARQAGG